MSEISSYGCAGDLRPRRRRSHHHVDSWRSPSPRTRPSNLAVMGRYVFTPAIFDELARSQPGVGGEIQLTDAMDALIRREGFAGYVFSEGRYDIGQKLDYLRATVELALEHPELGPDFRAFLADLAKRRLARLTRRLAGRRAAGPLPVAAMIPLAEARARVLAGCGRSQPRAHALADARGLRHRRRRGGDRAVPPFPNTAVDGFAVRAADVAEASPGRPARLGGGGHARRRCRARPGGRARRGRADHDRGAAAARRRRGGDGRGQPPVGRRRHRRADAPAPGG